MKRYYHQGVRISRKTYIGSVRYANARNLPISDYKVVDDVNVRAGVCRYCGCSELDPCIHPDYGACSWADDEHTVCSWCMAGVLSLQERREVVHCVNSNSMI